MRVGGTDGRMDGWKAARRRKEREHGGGEDALTVSREPLSEGTDR